MLNWGVIGAGGIADRRTIPEGIIPARNAQLAAVMDADEERARAAGEKYGVPYYIQAKDLLSDRKVEAVYVATPVHLHPEHTIMAANAGKHVLCEKAMAITIEECGRMIDACRGNRVKLGIGFMMRFHAVHRKAQEMVEEGLLGQPVFGRAQLSCWYPPIPGAWRQIPELGGGGSLVDMGNHCIDVLEMLMGKVVEVSCFTGSLVHGYAAEDIATVLLRFESGAQGVVDACFNIPDESSKNILEVYGTKGSLLARGTIGQMPDGDMVAHLERDEQGYDAKQQRVTSTSENISPTPVNMYEAEIEHFSECVERDVPLAISGEDGLWSQKIVLACYESARTGRAVKVN